MKRHVEDDPRRPPQLILEARQFLHRLADVPELLHELLAVERPPLHEQGGEDAPQLAGEGLRVPVGVHELEVMARVGLVEARYRDLGVVVARQLLLLGLPRHPPVHGRDEEDPFLLLLQGPGHHVRRVGDDGPHRGRGCLDREALPRGDGGDALLLNEPPHPLHFLAVHGQELAPLGVVLLCLVEDLAGGLPRGDLRGDGLHEGFGVPEDLPTSLEELVGCVVEEMVLVEDLLEELFARRELALCPGKDLPLQERDVVPNRSRSGPAGADCAGRKARGAEAQKRDDSPEEDQASLPPLDRDLRPHLGDLFWDEVLLPLAEHAGDLREAPDDAPHPHAQWGEVPHEEEEYAPQGLVEVHPRAPFVVARLLEPASERLRELANEGVVDLGIAGPRRGVKRLQFSEGIAEHLLLAGPGGRAVVPQPMVVAMVAELGRGDRDLLEHPAEEPVYSSVELGFAYGGHVLLLGLPPRLRRQGKDTRWGPAALLTRARGADGRCGTGTTPRRRSRPRGGAGRGSTPPGGGRGPQTAG